MRVRAGIAVLAVALGVMSFGGTTEPATRSLAMRGLELGKGEAVAFALHPTTVPIEIEGPNKPLEACQATLEGGVGGSWPRFAGFAECVPLEDGHATLPSVGVDTFHLAFLVRGVGGRAVNVNRLEITYEPGDGFFRVFPPPIPRGVSNFRVLVTPEAREVVYASIGEPETYRSITNGVELWVSQGGERLAETDAEPSQAGPAYGPADVGQPVKLRILNDTDDLLVIGLFIDWS